MPALLEMMYLHFEPEDPRGDEGAADVVGVESKLIGARHPAQRAGAGWAAAQRLQIEGFGAEAVCAKVEYFCHLYY